MELAPPCRGLSIPKSNAVAHRSKPVHGAVVVAAAKQSHAEKLSHFLLAAVNPTTASVRLVRNSICVESNCTKSRALQSYEAPRLISIMSPTIERSNVSHQSDSSVLILNRMKSLLDLE